jgi:hypothetical protein
MDGSAPKTIDDLERFDAVRDGWPRLEELLGQVQQVPTTGQVVDALLSVFERYPGILTAGGLLMSVMHSIEKMPAFEIHIVDSFRRAPSILSVMIINRLLNSGVSTVGSESLLQLLKSAHASKITQHAVKREIDRVLEGRS